MSCGKDYLSSPAQLQPSQELALPEMPVAEVIEAAPEPSPAPTTAPAPPPPTTPATGKDGAVIPMMNVPTFNYYTLPDNSLPLFSKSCLIVENPTACSTASLREWLQTELAKTENGLKSGEHSVQYIVFEINQKGEVFNVEHVGSDGNVFCWPCVKTAVETVGKMPNWTPAMRNGKPVNTSLKLPLRFEAG